MQPGTPEEARVPEVSLALDGLTLDGGTEHRTPVLSYPGRSNLRLVGAI